MDSLWQDCRYAARTLSKSPGFTVVAVLVLALGIGANAATFTLTNALLLRPIHAESPDELVALYNKNVEKPGVYRAFSYPNFQDIRELNTAFSSVMAHDMTTVGLQEGEVTRRVFAEIVTHDYFETFGVQPHRGRFFSEAEERPGSGIPVAVVSHEYWRRHGSDPDLVGRTLEVNGQPLTIVGVAPPGFTGRTAILAPALYLPFGMHQRLMDEMFADGDATLAARDNHRILVVGRLRPELTPAEADERLATLAARLGEAYPEINGDYTLTVGPLSRMSIGTHPSDDGELTLLAVALLGMTGIVLLIACIDLANMLLARGAARSREFAVRAALGGQRRRIMRQLLTEGLILSVLGGAAGLLVAYWANGLLGASVNELMAINGFNMDIVLRAAPDLRVLGATAGFCVLGTLLFGLGPAWRHSRPDVMETLKEGAGRGTAAAGARRLLSGRNLLVVGQVALSLVLLTAAGLFTRAAFEAADVDPGFDVEHGLLVEVDPALAGIDDERSRELHRRLHGRLAALPGIESVSVATTVPFGSVTTGRGVRRAEDLPDSSGDDGERGESVGATSNVVGAGYFETLGIPVLRGRGFTRAETDSEAGPPVAVIDELLGERLWPGRNPVGRRISLGRASEDDRGGIEVVGVVSTVRDDLFPAEPRPHVYLPFGRHFQTGANIHLRASSADPEAKAALLGSVRREIRAVDERLPILGLRTLQAHVAGSPSLWIVRTGATIFGAFGALALSLAVVGVYGVKAYTVARRTREIGIRKALGASAGGTLWLVVREGMALTGVGLAVGLLLAAGVARLLGSMLYEVSSLDPVAFLAAPLILAAASLLATYVPARRAARVDPMTALRTE